MIQIQTLEVAGLSPTLHAMRNPLDSWDKSDSPREFGAKPGEFAVGPADKGLSLRLQKAGPEHCKHLRMVVVWADITAPLYWYKELDTYRAGVEKLSCSTMHTITKKPFDNTMFSDDHLTVYSSVTLQAIIDTLNKYREAYLVEEDPATKKLLWWQLIQLLPSSFNQKRTVMFSYAALRNIYRQREGHRLDEWHRFREWCETLPEAWMIAE